MTFKKHPQNPLFGNEEIGTAFDVYVTKTDGKYRLDFSWRREKSLAVIFSDDGIHWSEPIITLAPLEESGWEERVSRNCVLLIDGVYKMWYTGHARGHTFIGYAESTDGLHFERKCAEPIIIPEFPWEKDAVMNPSVLFENGKYRMWYAAGETYEPNVLAYAESDDGINWKKSRINPILVKEPENYYEKDRLGGCQVIKTDDMGYLCFYIGYEDINTARICVARSKNGVTGWERSSLNPLVSPDKGAWDGDACYKPSALWEEELGLWRIWYNGRCGVPEYIGLAEYEERNLF